VRFQILTNSLQLSRRHADGNLIRPRLCTQVRSNWPSMPHRQGPTTAESDARVERPQLCRRAALTRPVTAPRRAVSHSLLRTPPAQRCAPCGATAFVSLAATLQCDFRWCLYDRSPVQLDAITTKAQTRLSATKALATHGIQLPNAVTVKTVR
jgi:hypothetical protein